MTGLNWHGATIGIVVLTISICFDSVHGAVFNATNKHSSDQKISISLSYRSNNFADGRLGSLQTVDPKYQFYISSAMRNWANCLNNCQEDRYKTADTSKDDQMDALLETIKLYKFPDETKFWIFTCLPDQSYDCKIHCTEVIYYEDIGLKIDVLGDKTCEEDRIYICRK